MADSEDTTTLPARRDVETWIDGLVDLLDTLDDDADLEDPGDLEPALGWHDDRSQRRLNAYAQGEPDLEAEHDGREPGVDDEPSLGAPDAIVDQTRWAAGSVRDLENDWAEHEHSIQVAAGDDWQTLRRPACSWRTPERCDLEVAAADDARRVRRARRAAQWA